MAAETSQTLDRGVRVLKVLAETPAGLTVTELATALGANRTVVHRLVTTLGEHGLVRRAAGGRVQMGLGVLELARSVQPTLRDVAAPILRQLADATGCTAHLSVADGTEALAIAVVEPSWTDFHVAYRVGARHPLSAGAAGRAILAGRSGDTRPVATVGELQPGARGLAVPVLGVAGLEASVGVVTLADLDVEPVGTHLSNAAHHLAAAL